MSKLTLKLPSKTWPPHFKIPATPPKFFLGMYKFDCFYGASALHCARTFTKVLLSIYLSSCLSLALTLSIYFSFSISLSKKADFEHLKFKIKFQTNNNYLKLKARSRRVDESFLMITSSIKCFIVNIQL